MWKRLAVIFIVIVVLLGSGVFALVKSPQFDQFRAKLENKPKAKVVRLEAVSRGDLTRTVNAPGSIEPRNMVNISSRVSAMITAMPFKEGDHVKEGDVLVRLDSKDLVASLESTQAQLKSEEARVESAKASLVEADLAVVRARELLTTNDISKAELDAAEARFRQAQAGVKMAEQSIEIARSSITRAKKNVDYTVITSPIDGTITRLNNKIGENVLGTFNNIGSTIMTIADMSDMLMRARVDESNVALIESDQDATIYINAFPDETFQGTVDRVKLHREVWRDGTAYIEAEISINMPGDRLLWLGGNANTDIQIKTTRDVIKIPSQAVMDLAIDDLPSDIRKENPNVDQKKTHARVVYRFVDGKAVVTPVSVGTSDLTHTVVLSGLSDDDRIIVGPYKELLKIKHDELVRDEEDVKKENEQEKAAEESASEEETDTQAPGEKG